MLHWVIRLVDKVIGFKTAKAHSITVSDMAMQAAQRRHRIQSQSSFCRAK
ncbi:hypothetical protein MSP8887_01849 [Marinomonas spartinae]|uniref:Uncharacterized protein n=1 Tax=Marinomonas spartinae TaxID=1792290 RepID=A0A1A8TQR7_9GAMM|nr:hypothetical protein MSP8887_01849 [Marinomonas spartinae]SBS35800.1 hypothetical protein MSP8886_03487 [Marinomonas spartinae]